MQYNVVRILSQLGHAPGSWGKQVSIVQVELMFPKRLQEFVQSEMFESSQKLVLFHNFGIVVLFYIGQKLNDFFTVIWFGFFFPMGRWSPLQSLMMRRKLTLVYL